MLQTINWETLLPDGDKDKVSLQRVGGECKLWRPPRYFMRLFIDNAHSLQHCACSAPLPPPLSVSPICHSLTV